MATADAIFSCLHLDAAWNETLNNALSTAIFEARATVDGPSAARSMPTPEADERRRCPLIPAFFDLLGGQRDWVEGYQLHPRGAVFRLDFVSLRQCEAQLSEERIRACRRLYRKRILLIGYTLLVVSLMLYDHPGSADAAA